MGKVNFGVRIPQGTMDQMTDAAKAHGMSVPEFARVALAVASGSNRSEFETLAAEYQAMGKANKKALLLIETQKEIYQELKKQSTDLARASISLVAKAQKAAGREAAARFGVK